MGRLGIIALGALVALSTTVAATGPATAQATCTPTYSITGVNDFEGDSKKSFDFVVNLHVPSGCARIGTVSYQVLPDTAHAEQDFVAASGQLSWTGQTGPQQVRVAIVPDATPEPTEQFIVRLGTPSATQARGTLHDDDGYSTADPVQAGILSDKICWVPGDCFVSVKLNAAQRLPVTVIARTYDGTAYAGKDYVHVKDVPVTIPRGTTTADLPITLLPDDGPEADEFFTVELIWSSAGSFSDPDGVVTLAQRR